MDGVLSPMYGPASIGMDLMFMAGLPDPFEWYDSRGGKYNFAEDAARSMAAVRTGVEMADPLVKTAKGQTDKIEWGEWVKRVLGVRSAYNFTEGMVELFDK